MYKRIIAQIFILLLIFALLPINVMAENDFDINAKSAILIDAKSGQVIYEKNSHEKLPPASVTKVMTMLLTMEALENNQIDLDDVVTISDRASSMGGSQLYMEPGEQQTVDTLIKGIAVCSANDACVAMGEYIAGSEELFVKQMNERAAELGMENTNFVNTNGLTVEGHYTTAYDIALMSRELLKHPKIHDYLTIWMDTVTVGKPSRTDKTEIGITNTNRLIKTYPGANGIKTGYTDAAKYCLSASATKGNMTLISVVLGCPTTKVRFAESAKLLDYGFAAYESLHMASENQVMGKIRVDKGKSDFINAVAEDNINILVRKNEKQAIRKEIFLAENIQAPLKKGDIIGELVVYKNDEVYKTFPLVCETDVEKAGVLSMYYKLFKNII